jgi:hypothetical protein
VNDAVKRNGRAIVYHCDYGEEGHGIDGVGCGG